LRQRAPDEAAHRFRVVLDRGVRLEAAFEHAVEFQEMPRQPRPHRPDDFDRARRAPGRDDLQRRQIEAFEIGTPSSDTRCAGAQQKCVTRSRSISRSAARPRTPPARSRAAGEDPLEHVEEAPIEPDPGRTARRARCPVRAMGFVTKTRRANWSVVGCSTALGSPVVPEVNAVRHRSLASGRRRRNRSRSNTGASAASRKPRRSEIGRWHLVPDTSTC